MTTRQIAKIFFWSLAGFLLLAIALATSLYYSRGVAQPDQAVCTQEVKICPDGSYVGRTGPACEFAPCPGADNPDASLIDTSAWKTYRNEQYGFEIKHPHEWIVTTKGEEKDIYLEDTTKQAEYGGGYRGILFISPEAAESLEDWYKENIAAVYDSNDPSLYKEIVINGIKGRELPTYISYGGCDRDVALFHNKAKLAFRIARFGGTCDYDDELIDLVISTFKLTK